MATVVSTIFLASCAGDVYDPSKEPQASCTIPVRNRRHLQQKILSGKALQPRMALVGL